MPIPKKELVKTKAILETELARNNINPKRKLAVEQELKSISDCLKGR